MTNLPYLPFFIGDYLKETRHLTTEQHGAYLLLLFEYWVKQGSLPDDDAQLSRIVGLPLPKWKKIRPVVHAFFTDGWRHERMDHELVNAAARRQKARKAANTKHSNHHLRLVAS